MWNVFNHLMTLSLLLLPALCEQRDQSEGFLTSIFLIPCITFCLHHFQRKPRGDDSVTTASYFQSVFIRHFPLMVKAQLFFIELDA